METITGFITICTIFFMFCGILTLSIAYFSDKIMPGNDDWLTLMICSSWIISYFYFGGR